MRRGAKTAQGRACIRYRAWHLAVLALAGAVLTGCGYDVQLEGKVFDAIGIGTNSKKAHLEPKLAPRSGLVPPPDVSRLPPPGSGGGTAVANAPASWPVDPEVRAAALEADRKRQLRKYCEGQEWRGAVNGDRLPDNIDPKCRGFAHEMINKAVAKQRAQYERNVGPEKDSVFKP